MRENLSLQTLQRLPLYLGLVKAKMDTGTNISASAIAGELGLTEIQVRKDLASVSDGGRPKVGFFIPDLVADLERALGYDNTDDAVLVGAGNLGRALLSYGGFSEYGLNIVAAFDCCPKEGDSVHGKPVLPMDMLPDLCRRLSVHIGIVTVPKEQAQSVCDLLVESGVIAIWNFAPAHLLVPDGILVKSENMAASLAQLSRHLRDHMKESE